MTALSSEQVTQLLVAWSNGDKAAFNELMPLVYRDLRKLARRYLSREGADHTLQTTALYMKLISGSLGKENLRGRTALISLQLQLR